MTEYVTNRYGYPSKVTEVTEISTTTCRWHQDDDGAWYSACGEVWNSAIHGLPPATCACDRAVLTNNGALPDRRKPNPELERLRGLVAELNAELERKRVTIAGLAAELLECRMGGGR